MTSYSTQSDIVSNLSAPYPQQAMNKRIIYGLGAVAVVVILALSIALGVVANKDNDKQTYNYPPNVQPSSSVSQQAQQPATCPQQTTSCKPQVIMCPEPYIPEPEIKRPEMPTTAECLKQYGNPTHLQIANCVLECFPLIDGYVWSKFSCIYIFM